MRLRKYRKELFVERLSELIKEKGLTQKSLAEKALVSRKTINEYVLGKTEPVKNGKPNAVIGDIAAALNVDVEYLLGQTPYRTQEEETLANIDKSIDAAKEWCVDAEIRKRFSATFPRFDAEKYSENELKELSQRIRNQIHMVLLSFEQERK